MDLVVVLWKIFLFHGLGCCPMEDFWSYGLGCRPMKDFLFHGLGCRPMEDFFVPWTWLLSYGRFLTWVSSYEMFASMDLGVDDAVHVSEEIDEVGITGEAPNPHPEQYFWSFNGPLVPFGDFWVPNDCSPYLSRLSAGHSDFTKGFKLSIGLGGPMLSLLGSVLAAMDESSLEDVTKTQILAWRSVIQDLMDVGFDLGFMIERLRQTAQCLFGKRIADEIKALQHQIALLQDSLAELTAYQDKMMSTGRMVLRYGPSQFDADLDGEGTSPHMPPSAVDQLQDDGMREDLQLNSPVESPKCGCQKFQHRIGHVPIREKGEYGPDLCVWGMLSPKTRLQVRGYGGLMKTGTTDQDKMLTQGVAVDGLKVFLVYRGPTGSVPWTAVGFVFLELLNWCCRGPVCNAVHRDQWVKRMPSRLFHHYLLQLDTDSGRPWRLLGLFSPCIIFLVITFITHHSWCRRRLLLWLGLVVNRWVICRGPLGNPPWTTGWRG
uniref:Rx N-terminal domain-containing protein n=1 Tax=Fagus sylvatica TaxID=28930 RepID=A0A2N9FU25_FAGSY